MPNVADRSPRPDRRPPGAPRPRPEGRPQPRSGIVPGRLTPDTRSTLPRPINGRKFYAGDRRPLGRLLGESLGLGSARVRRLCALAGLPPAIPVHRVTLAQARILTQQTAPLLWGRKLERRSRIRLLEICRSRSYRAQRLQQNLPVRGQRTHTNAQSAHHRSPALLRLVLATLPPGSVPPPQAKAKGRGKPKPQAKAKGR